MPPRMSLAFSDGGASRSRASHFMMTTPSWHKIAAAAAASAALGP
eukprot:CAMPEP_0115842196 /NCGR_PEP_ID=MMETSP0287-20121206/7676_1 /TAXON_ID=412157 /ORGANISM="Chrysochromulina rotalis, Strain UIO044" /LENGTH=44 /DNA_ID= /DNA_START= /DNA_END= /DNA_ORIENTATION=